MICYKFVLHKYSSTLNNNSHRTQLKNKLRNSVIELQPFKLNIHCITIFTPSNNIKIKLFQAFITYKYEFEC